MYIRPEGIEGVSHEAGGAVCEEGAVAWDLDEGNRRRTGGLVADYGDVVSYDISGSPARRLPLLCRVV